LKTYRAIRHDIVRARQASNAADAHHPYEKEGQIRKYVVGLEQPRILELFAGQGNLTRVYNEIGSVDSYDRKYLGTGDSYLVFHRLIADKAKYQVVDLDPYGFPNRFFPDIFLLIDKGYLLVTMPKPSVNILNGITQTHLISYYGTHNPSHEQIIERIALWGLCHWREVALLNSLNCRSVWRLVFSVERVRATEYTGVRNRPDSSEGTQAVPLAMELIC